MAQDPPEPNVHPFVAMLATAAEPYMLAQAPLEMAKRLIALERTGLSAKVAEAVVITDERCRGDIAQLGQLVVDLGAVVLAQQHMIAELTQRLDTIQAERLQVVLQREAMRDAREMLEGAVAGIAGHLEEYEVSVGEISTDVQFSIEDIAEEVVKEAHSASNENRSERDVEVDLELKGIATRLAGLKGAVSVDTSTLTKRAESLGTERATKRKESITGRTKIAVGGVSARKGRK